MGRGSNITELYREATRLYEIEPKSASGYCPVDIADYPGSYDKYIIALAGIIDAHSVNVAGNPFNG